MNSRFVLIFGAVASPLFGIVASEQECFPFESQCDNGKCILMDWVCDGDNDRGDMSDEPDSPEECPECRLRQFRCNNGRCISANYTCDGNNDCGNESDEFDEKTGGCPVCADYLFSCDNERCLNVSYICNGRNDCVDWSDETVEACPCADNEIRCSKSPNDDPPARGVCIPEEWICDDDGIWDCPAGNDEKNCTVNTLDKRRLIF